jgi:hypothetical protein
MADRLFSARAVDATSLAFVTFGKSPLGSMRELGVFVHASVCRDSGVQFPREPQSNQLP